MHIRTLLYVCGKFLISGPELINHQMDLLARVDRFITTSKQTLDSEL